jgi:L-alanine-DL-glutamate epimerase-like enolase superfamily enzyme
LRIVDVRERVVSIGSAIKNAYIDFSQMTVSVVAVLTDLARDGCPVVGYGFNSNGRYSVSGLLRERFIPRLLAARPDDILDAQSGIIDPVRAWSAMMRNEKPGGHGERSVAVGVLDMALWDAAAKAAELPLFRLLAGRFGTGEADRDVFVYAAGGYYYPGKGLSELQDEFRRYRDLGYVVCKMKIGGASLDEDRRRIDAALEVVGSPENLAVDANGRFALTDGIRWAEAMAPYRLRWLEEIGDPLDYQLNAAVASIYDGPIATGENLFSHQDARNLLRYGGMRPDRDILQFDCALSYGLVEYLRMLDAVRAAGWSPRRCIPHGGHQMSLNIAAGLGLGGNESYPEVFRPFNGFADGFPVVDGRVRLPEAPGVGIELKSELYGVLKDLAL